MLVSLLFLSSVAHASVFEKDMSPEREPFPEARTTVTGMSLEDPVDDLVIFDKEGRGQMPPVLADATALTITAGDLGWTAVFTTKDPLPEDPALSVNFDIFIDRDGVLTNNAKNGVFRTGADTIFMVLFGTRTKWHSTWWTHNAQDGTWTEQGTKPDFSVEGNTVTMQIPYAAVPRGENIMMRGLTLTSTGGITATDIVPGTDFPPILATAPAPEPTSPVTAGAPDMRDTIYMIIGTMIGAGVLIWFFKRK